MKVNVRALGFAVLVSAAGAYGCGSDSGSPVDGGADMRDAASGGGRGGGTTATGGVGSGGIGAGGLGGGGLLATGGAGGAGATGGAPIAGTSGSASGGAGGGGLASGGAGAGGSASGGAGGSASGGAGGSASGGAGGGGVRMAAASVAPINSGTITGTAAFVQTSTGVRITVNLTNCPEGRHPIHIHSGDACTNATTQGGHWGPTRGENIGPNGGEITCDSMMRGTLVYTRLNPDPVTRWTIGDGAVSDIVGHPIVVHGLASADREGCGIIKLTGTGAGGAGGATTGSGGAAAGGRTGSAGAPGVGGAAGGSTGAAGAGGTAGAVGTAGSTGTAGAGGGAAAKTAAAAMTPFSTGTITGTVSFVEVSNGVRVTYNIANCPLGQHPTHIHEGSGCDSVTAQGAHWGPTRGENIGPSGGEISCDATQKGTLTYVRENGDPTTKWTIGDGSVSDIVGHPVIIHGLTATARESCGVIQRTGAGGSGAGGAGGSGAGGAGGSS